MINFVPFSKRFRTITKILYHGNINIAIDIYNNIIIISIYKICYIAAFSIFCKCIPYTLFE